MKEIYLTRQLDIIPTKVLGQEIHIIGVGAIGSFVTLSLAKMGFNNLTVYDDDKVDDVNMNCQFYRYKDIGKKKADALYDLVKDFTDTEINPVPKRYEQGKLNGIVISAVDSMEVRRIIFENHKKAWGTKLVIDPRMSAEYAVMYAMDLRNPKDIESYEKTLFSDSDGVQERCTAKSTMYTVGMIAGLVCQVVKDVVTDKPYVRNADWAIENHSFQCWEKK